MQLPISLGNQGFASLRENHCFYMQKHNKNLIIR